MNIPFNRLYISGNELSYLAEAVSYNTISGDGLFTKRCHNWLEANTNCSKALLTHSCTAALEMAALICDIEPGDEIIMPSYTFVSTANAFVLRGGIPVFIDIREDTLNINEHLIEAAITPRTKAIVPVHYAGVACEMHTIMDLANHYKLPVIEDAAQAIMASYYGRALGSFGDLGALSFHGTKNVISGEGGAILVNDEQLASRATIIWEKGTDRSSFLKGEIDKYTWQEAGSSFLPGELTAAFLYAQFEKAELITQQRLKIWDYYHTLLESLEARGALRRPIIPNGAQHNAHMYYILLNPKADRQAVLHALKQNDVHATSHYVPLHSSPAGQKYCRTHGLLEVTNRQSQQLIRLPLWVGLTQVQQNKIISLIDEIL